MATFTGPLHFTFLGKPGVLDVTMGEGLDAVLARLLAAVAEPGSPTHTPQHPTPGRTLQLRLGSGSVATAIRPALPYTVDYAPVQAPAAAVAAVGLHEGAGGGGGAAAMPAQGGRWGGGGGGGDGYDSDDSDGYYSDESEGSVDLAEVAGAPRRQRRAAGTVLTVDQELRPSRHATQRQEERNVSTRLIKALLRRGLPVSLDLDRQDPRGFGGSAKLKVQGAVCSGVVVYQIDRAPFMVTCYNTNITGDFEGGDGSTVYLSAFGRYCTYLRLLPDGAVGLGLGVLAGQHASGIPVPGAAGESAWEEALAEEGAAAAAADDTAAAAAAPAHRPHGARSSYGLHFSVLEVLLPAEGQHAPTSWRRSLFIRDPILSDLDPEATAKANPGIQFAFNVEEAVSSLPGSIRQRLAAFARPEIAEANKRHCDLTSLQLEVSLSTPTLPGAPAVTPITWRRPHGIRSSAFTSAGTHIVSMQSTRALLYDALNAAMARVQLPMEHAMGLSGKFCMFEGGHAGLGIKMRTFLQLPPPVNAPPSATPVPLCFWMEDTCDLQWIVGDGDREDDWPMRAAPVDRANGFICGLACFVNNSDASHSECDALGPFRRQLLGIREFGDTVLLCSKYPMLSQKRYDRRRDGYIDLTVSSQTFYPAVPRDMSPPAALAAARAAAMLARWGDARWFMCRVSRGDSLLPPFASHGGLLWHSSDDTPGQLGARFTARLPAEGGALVPPLTEDLLFQQPVFIIKDPLDLVRESLELEQGEGLEAAHLPPPSWEATKASLLLPSSPSTLASSGLTKLLTFSLQHLRRYSGLDDLCLEHKNALLRAAGCGYVGCLRAVMAAVERQATPQHPSCLSRIPALVERRNQRIEDGPWHVRIKRGKLESPFLEAVKKGRALVVRHLEAEAPRLFGADPGAAAFMRHLPAPPLQDPCGLDPYGAPWLSVPVLSGTAHSSDPGLNTDFEEAIHLLGMQAPVTIPFSGARPAPTSHAKWFSRWAWNSGSMNTFNFSNPHPDGLVPLLRLPGEKPAFGAWAELVLKVPHQLHSYALRSADDCPERDPVAWRLWGYTSSTSQGCWRLLHAFDADAEGCASAGLPSEQRWAVRSFCLPPPHVKGVLSVCLEVLRVRKAGTGMQLASLRLGGVACAAGADEEAAGGGGDVGTEVGEWDEYEAALLAPSRAHEDEEGEGPRHVPRGGRRRGHLERGEQVARLRGDQRSRGAGE